MRIQLIVIFSFLFLSLQVSGNELHRAFQEQSSVNVILALKTRAASHSEWRNLEQHIDVIQQKLINEMGWVNINHLVRYKNAPFIAKAVARSEYDRLRQSEFVDTIYLDKFTLLRAPEASRQLPNRKTADINPKIKQVNAVAVIDSGIDFNHPYLKNKVVAGACFSASGHCPNKEKKQFGIQAGKPCLFNGCNHGTHVAGISVGENVQHRGVAPQSQLVSINAMSHNGFGAGFTDSDILQSLDWVLTNHKKYNISVVNMSLGGGRFYDNCDTDYPYTALINQLRDNNILTVIASGNDYLTDSIGAPACISSAVSVGSVNYDGEVSDFSNSYKRITIMAHGSKILSSVPGGQLEVMSGTSMASPQVAGAVSLLKSVYPSATAEQLYRSMLSGDDFLDSRNQVKTKKLNVKKSLAYLKQQFKRAPDKTKPIKEDTNNCSNKIDGILIEKSNTDCGKAIRW
ncbi:hypothetical protein CXF85_11140 [Colwellia sp. 75C3]|uniref:S8 family peptidase n=1 Tax=Colwellia sp. 75C3 TaxID=888425 RepID=UPI000C3427E4|nr:S8 family serine peptidase [Colwellia sp. 75C3]PKG83277.1 hypothetical protein CXF85_11140 [Colwellia sp. 75C3]